MDFDIVIILCFLTGIIFIFLDLKLKSQNNLIFALGVVFIIIALYFIYQKISKPDIDGFRFKS